MRLKRALDEFVVDGIETTLPLFRALAREAEIIDGDYHIHWLEEFLARGARWRSSRLQIQAGTRSAADFTALARTRPIREGT
jgi:acetyl/propionyl-CoA carboxylase alpha subunit